MQTTEPKMSFGPQETELQQITRQHNAKRNLNEIKSTLTKQVEVSFLAFLYFWDFLTKFGGYFVYLQQKKAL